MIFDWLENCEQIERTGCFTLDDNWDEKALPKQEYRYVEYLRYNKRLSKDEAKKRWLNTKGGYAEIFEYDVDMQDSQFDKIWNAMESRKYRMPITRPLDVCIRKGELDYINGLDAPLWVKQYWFGLLVWLKHQYVNHRPMRNHEDVQAWIVRQLDAPYTTPDNLRRQINLWNIRCGGVTSKVAGHKKKNGKEKEKFMTLLTMSSAEILPRRIKSEVVAEGLNPENFAAYLAYVEPTMVKCPSCGNMFIKNYRGKTDLCPDCEREKRKKAAAEAMRRLRSKEKPEEVGT